MATTEIQTWLASVDFDSDDEIYSLYKTAEERTANGHFTWAEQNVHSGKRCYLGCPNIPESLLLVSESAISEFLRQLQGYMKGYKSGMSLDEWYQLSKLQRED